MDNKNMSKYVLANRPERNNSKLVEAFENSILGMDIGVHNPNFGIMITLSTIIAISTLFGMYFLFRI